MLVITLQFSYTQETIYNALMKTMLKKKKVTLPPQLRYWLLWRSIHYTALQTNRDKPVTLTLPYSALSMCWWPCVHHLAFQLLCCLKKKKKERKEKQKITCQCIDGHCWSLSVKKKKSCAAFLYTWRCLSCNCIKYCYRQKKTNFSIWSLGTDRVRYCAS